MGIDWPVTVGAPLDPLFPGNDDDPGKHHIQPN